MTDDFPCCTAPAPEPSREDLYEAAVRAVLDLCDREDAEAQIGTSYVATALISSADVRAAIRGALESPSALAAGEADNRAPLSISGPGAGSAKISLAGVPGAPETAPEVRCLNCGRPLVLNTQPRHRWAVPAPGPLWLHRTEDFDPKLPIDCFAPVPEELRP